MFFSLFHELINHAEEAFGYFILLFIFVKMRQSSLLQKTASTFEGVISDTLKLGAIVSLWRSFQLHRFQCQMLTYSGLLHFEIVKCLILACTTLTSNLWKFWNCPRFTQAVQNFQKWTRAIYSKSLSQTCDY